MNRHRRRVWELGTGLGFLLTIVLTLVMGWRQTVAAQVRADTIRLHVLANSDTIEDQLLKLQVRDAILAALPATVTGATSPQAAQQALQCALPALRAAVNRTLLDAHSGQTATVRLETFAFSARDYGDFALPGGDYTALRVELGAARGHNWFCVLYPELCIGSSGARYEDDAENALVFGGYEIRFALLDGAKKLADTISNAVS